MGVICLIQRQWRRSVFTTIPSAARVSHLADRKVRDSARGVALRALRQWRTGAGLADAILARHLKSTDLVAADRNFSTELFYGVLRNLSLLDYWIGLLRPGHLHPGVRDLLRLG